MEPFIDEKTMRLHHDRHLQSYIDKLNEALKPYPALQGLTLEELIGRAGRLPQPLQTAVRNNAGGVYNHRFFFEGLKNSSRHGPEGGLASAINASFGSFERFLEVVKAAAGSVFGSGYAWLACRNGRLQIVTTPNQNNPLEQGLRPVLVVDVWEHAYYLKHYNLRADYLEDWMRVIDWERAARRYWGCL